MCFYSLLTVQILLLLLQDLKTDGDRKDKKNTKFYTAQYAQHALANYKTSKEILNMTNKDTD